MVGSGSAEQPATSARIQSARYVVRLLPAEGNAGPDAGYLKENTADWLPSHFDPASYKSKRRKYFATPEK